MLNSIISLPLNLLPLKFIVSRETSSSKLIGIKLEKWFTPREKIFSPIRFSINKGTSSKSLFFFKPITLGDLHFTNSSRISLENWAYFFHLIGFLTGNLSLTPFSFFVNLRNSYQTWKTHFHFLSISPHMRICLQIARLAYLSLSPFFLLLELPMIMGSARIWGEEIIKKIDFDLWGFDNRKRRNIRGCNY